MEARKPKKLKLKKRLDEALYDEMLNNFLKGKYVEGTEFNPALIAQDYDISVTPVILTLKRMYYERLIDRTKGGKYLVPECTVADVINLCDARFMIEQKCLLAIIERNDQHSMDEIVRIADECVAHVRAGDIIKSIRSDLDLHKAFVESYGNAYVNQFYMQIRNKLISWSYIFGFNEDLQEDACKEHMQIIEAMLDRNSTRVSELLAFHVECVRLRIVEYIDAKHP